MSLSKRWKVARTLGIAKTTLTDGEIVKECILKTVEEICPDKMNLFKGVSSSACRRTADLENDIVRQLKETAKS